MTDSMHSAQFPALGTTAVVAVSDAARLSDATAAVQRTVEEFDLACSRFRDDSELCALNAAAGRPVPVSPLLLEAVEAALRAARLTGGDVDPTIGEALIGFGYDRDFSLVGDAPQIAAAAVAGWQTVVVDSERSTIRAPRGVVLDLGATAKALAADHAAARAAQAAGCSVLVSLGGDLASAGGAPPEGWLVRVTDDHAAGVEAPGQWITIRSGGLATSSTTVRRWRAGDGTAHHLIDPHRGVPADGPWRTVSVTASSCLDANIASTAAIIRGEQAVDWLEQLGLPARLVGTDGIAHHVAGWPPERDDFRTASAGPGREEVVLTQSGTGS